MRIFVPGRICLFGEHSDWAGGYRRVNADLEKRVYNNYWYESRPLRQSNTSPNQAYSSCYIE